MCVFLSLILYAQCRAMLRCHFCLEIHSVSIFQSYCPKKDRRRFTYRSYGSPSSIWSTAAPQQPVALLAARAALTVVHRRCQEPRPHQPDGSSVVADWRTPHAVQPTVTKQHGICARRDRRRQDSGCGTPERGMRRYRTQCAHTFNRLLPCLPRICSVVRISLFSPLFVC